MNFSPILISVGLKVKTDSHLYSGCFVKGLFLEGAGWNNELGCLEKSQPKVLIQQLPILKIIPIEVHRLKLQVNTREHGIHEVVIIKLVFLSLILYLSFFHRTPTGLQFTPRPSAGMLWVSVSFLRPISTRKSTTVFGLWKAHVCSLIRIKVIYSSL